MFVNSQIWQIQANSYAYMEVIILDGVQGQPQCDILWVTFYNKLDKHGLDMQYTMQNLPETAIVFPVNHLCSK